MTPGGASNRRRGDYFERVTRDHAVGIGLAAVAIALIGYGSA